MFTFMLKKTIQASAYLLCRIPCREMNYMRLLKILYIADRESIRATGWPITGDRIAALERGPVLSQTLNLIKGAHLSYSEWERYIKRNEYNIQLVDDPGRDALSSFEIDILERVAEEHRSHDEWAMVEYTHDFPEWKDNYNKNHLIPTADIFEAVGRTLTPEDKQEIEEDRLFNSLFGS